MDPRSAELVSTLPKQCSHPQFLHERLANLRKKSAQTSSGEQRLSARNSESVIRPFDGVGYGGRASQDIQALPHTAGEYGMQRPFGRGKGDRTQRRILEKVRMRFATSGWRMSPCGAVFQTEHR